jgi:hypothetical protein
VHNLASVDINNTVRHTIQFILTICCVWIGVHLLHDPHLMRHHVTSKLPTRFVVVIDVAAFTDRVCVNLVHIDYVTRVAAAIIAHG